MGQQGLGEMDDHGERFADLCGTSNLCHRREFLQTPKYTQSDTGITRLADRESGSSHVHREESPKNSSKCASQGRHKCGFRPSSPGSTVEAQTEEQLD